MTRGERAEQLRTRLVQIEAARAALGPQDVGGVIAGTVTDAATGDSLAGVIVEIWDVGGSSVSTGVTDASGGYTAVGLPAGTYFATAGSYLSLLGELYEEMPCREVFVDCEPTSGTPIDLPSGTTVSGIDFTLDGGGVIAGKVTEAATGDPLAEIKIEIWDAAGRTISSGVTDASGEYAARGLPTGTYFVTTENFLGFIDEIYDDLQCPGSAARFNCFPTGGVPVEAAVGATTVGIDFTLDRLSAMSGTVVAETSGQPIPSYIMELFTARAPSTRSSMTFPAPTGRASTAFATSSREPWWRCNPQP